MRRIKGNDLKLGPIVGRPEMLTLPADARDKHLYVCGGTGTGKSKFLEFLIRQDIAQWRNNRCGLLLIDYHGSLYDSLLRWIVWHPHLKNRPIIPIELRSNDWVLAYNVLRQRQANPAVVVDTFVEAMAYTWGERGTDRTPLFARWASNTMRALYEKGFTLADAQHLTDRTNCHLRRTITAGLQDQVCEKDWAYANGLSPKDFDAQISSTLNRLGRFLRNDHMRAMFGQADVSLDLGKVLDEGAIVLVSLARTGGCVSKEDADLFATLLLSDLWTAAQERGKRDGIKPFRVYLDECQRFITPTIAENLDEARGFGLHMTLANQYPGQFLTRGDSGKQLYDSVMENATTKVCFRLTTEDNLKPMADWLFRGTMDPDEIKLKLFSTKVMGYSEETRTSHSRSSSRGSGGGSFAGESATGGKGRGESFDPEDELMGASESEQDSWSNASGQSESWSASESESTSESSVLVPEFGQELAHVQYRSLEEQLFRAMAVLFDKKERECVVRIGDRMSAPVSLRIPSVDDPPTPASWVTKYLEERYRSSPFFLPMSDALESLAVRSRQLTQELIIDEEPATAARFLDEEPMTAARLLPP